MVALNTIRYITIRGKTEGVDEAAGKLRNLAGAQNSVAVATENASKAQISMQSRVNAIARSLDAEYRAEQQLVKIERDLAAARAQGLISLDRQNQLLGLAAAKYKTTGESAIEMGEAMVTAKELAMGLVVGLGAGAFFTAVAELPDKIREVVEQAAGLSNVAETIGISTKNLQELQFAGELVDVSAESMTSALGKFSKAVGGAGAASSGLGKILKANHVAISGDLTTDLLRFADLVEKSSSAEQKNALIAEAFGKGAGNIGLLFNDGAQGLKKFMAEADNAGAVIDDKLLAVARALDDEFKTMALRGATAFKVFAIDAAPVVLAAMRGIDAAAQFIGQHFDVIGKVTAIAGAAVLGYFGPALLAAIADVTVAIGVGLVGAIRAVTVAMLENPLGLLIAGIAAAITAAFLFRDQIKQAIGIDFVAMLKQAGNFMIGTFIGAFNSVKDAWSLLPSAFADIFTMAMNGAIDIVQNGINGILGPINDLLTAVHLPGIGKADLQAWKGQVTGAAASVGDIVSKDMGSAYEPDYLGNMVSGLKSAWDSATGASGAVEDLGKHLDGAGVKGLDAGNKIHKGLTDAEKAAKKLAESIEQALGSALGSLFSGPITSLQDGIDKVLTSLGGLGQQNLQSIFSGAFGSESIGGTNPVPTDGSWVGKSGYAKVLEDAVRTGTHGGWLDALKNIPGGAGTVGSACAGLGVGYPTEDEKEAA